MIIIKIFEKIINIALYIYSEFNYLVLLLIFLIIFRKDISNLLKRLKSLHYTGNAGKVSAYLSDFSKISEDMEYFKNLKINEYGKVITDGPHLGGGGESEKTEEDYYFDLIYLPPFTNRIYAENGPFYTIKELYHAYKYFESKYLVKDEELVNIIENFYETILKIKKYGGNIMEEQTIYKYRDFIKLTMNVLELKQNRNN